MGLDCSRDAEVERLEAENADLRAQIERALRARGTSKGRSSGRRVAAATLIIIGAISLAVAVPAVWTRNLLLNTDRYTETVAPLADEPAIQKSVSVAAIDQIFARGDVENRIEEALPPKADFLSPSLTAELRALSINAGERALDTDAFRRLWVQANRRFHQAAVPFLRGEQGPRGVVDATQGTLSVDISEIMRQMKQSLADRGIEVAASVPDNALGGEVVLFQSDRLATVQEYVSTLEALAIALPLIALTAFALGVILAPSRRRAVLWSGVAVLAAMVLLVVAIGLVRATYLNSIDRVVLSRDAAAIFFDTMIRFLRVGVRSAAAFGLLAVVGAWLAGPSTVARAVRSGFSRGTARIESKLGIDVARSAEWTRAHRPPLYFLALLVGGGVLLMTDTVTASLALGVAVSVLIALILVEMFARADHAGPPLGRTLTRG